MDILAFLLGALFVLALNSIPSRRRQGVSLNLSLRHVRGRSTHMPRITRPPVEFLDVEKVLLSIAPQDADGRAVAGPFTWAVVNHQPTPGNSGDVATISPEPDGKSAWLVSGAPGTATVEVTYDLPGTDDELVEVMDVTIKTGEPSALNLSAGAPVPE